MPDCQDTIQQPLYRPEKVSADSINYWKPIRRSSRREKPRAWRRQRNDTPTAPLEAPLFSSSPARHKLLHGSARFGSAIHASKKRHRNVMSLVHSESSSRWLGLRGTTSPQQAKTAPCSHQLHTCTAEKAGTHVSAAGALCTGNYA